MANCNNNGKTFVVSLTTVPGGTAADASYLLQLDHYTCGNRKLCTQEVFPVTANLQATSLGQPVDVGNGAFCQEVLVSGSCLRTGFLKTIVNLLELVDILSPREGMVLSGFLDGSTLDDIAKDYGVTRERVRQIAEKAIYKSSDLMKIKDLLEENDKLKTDNAVLKSANDSLVRKLSVYEDAEPIDDGICRLFATRLVDYNLSVRTLNCLKMGAKSSCMHVIVPPCETVGDLCRLKRAEFLMIRGAGKGCLSELDDFLHKLGLSWDMDVDSICAKRH